MGPTLLISTYDLGRQPFGLASPAAWLREAGMDVACADLAKDELNADAVRAADVVAFFLPMHTATRLALPVIDRVRELNPRARLVAYGLYAPMNADLLRARGVTDILSGEFEADLVRVARLRAAEAGDASAENPEIADGPSHVARGTSPVARGTSPVARGTPGAVPRLDFRVPARDALPPLSRYATLQVGEERRTAGYTEASRGCKYRCRHCPVVPVYNGLFRIVQRDVVIADIRSQVAAGARHITFGDPDFFNGVGHATAVLEAFAREFPGITYDVTIKIEHLVRHAPLLEVLRRTGCAFVTSAVESLDDAVLAMLEKGHTRADFERVAGLCRDAGPALVPTFVAFMPWTTMTGYLELLRTIDRLELVEHVAPIQLAIRLLIPQGSRMLELEDVRSRISRYDPRSLTHVWTHADLRVDALQREVEAVVGTNLRADRRSLFAHIWSLAHDRAGMAPPPRTPIRAARATIPYLNEPWYC